MQDTDIVANEILNRFMNNLSVTAEQLRQGQWEMFYDKKSDEFFWSDPTALPSPESILFPIDNYLSISINKSSAKIEYFTIQSFYSVYAKEVPEIRPLAERLYKSKDSKGEKFWGVVDMLFGKLATTRYFAKAIA
jgi:hypothetical protein